MSTYQVVSVPGSTPCRAVFLTLEELNLPYEIVPVDLVNGEHKRPEFLAKHHPFGQIPILWDGDFKLFESRAIARYLVTKHKSDALYPTDEKKRALVEQWLSVNQSNNGPVIDIFVEFYINPTFYGKIPDDSKRPGMKEALDKYLAILDAHLSSSKCFVGDDLTLADIFFIPYFQYLVSCKGFDTAFDAFPHLKAWWETVSARPSWQKVATRPH